MELLDFPTEILGNILSYTVCKKDWRPNNCLQFESLNRRTVCSKLVSRFPLLIISVLNLPSFIPFSVFLLPRDNFSAG